MKIIVFQKKKKKKKKSHNIYLNKYLNVKRKDKKDQDLKKLKISIEPKTI